MVDSFVKSTASSAAMPIWSLATRRARHVLTSVLSSARACAHVLRIFFRIKNAIIHEQKMGGTTALKARLIIFVAEQLGRASKTSSGNPALLRCLAASSSARSWSGSISWRSESPESLSFPLSPRRFEIKWFPIPFYEDPLDRIMFGSLGSISSTKCDTTQYMKKWIFFNLVWSKLDL